MTSSEPTVIPLRQRMIDDVRMRQLFPKAQANYLRIVREFARYRHGRGAANQYSMTSCGDRSSRCCHRPNLGGSGMSRWRRLRDWQQAGVSDRLHEVLPGRLRAAHGIHWSRVIVESSSIPAVGSGQKQDLIPPIALDLVQNITSSREGKVSRSR